MFVEDPLDVIRVLNQPRDRTLLHDAEIEDVPKILESEAQGLLVSLLDAWFCLSLARTRKHQRTNASPLSLYAHIYVYIYLCVVPF